MIITDIKTYKHFSVWRNLVFVIIETDEGISGIGEATIRNKEMAVTEAIEHHLKPMLLGMSPFNIEQFFQKAFIRDAWRNGAVFNTAISGIEMAMWDIMGKKAGLPVYDFLGGKLQDKILLYANTWFMKAKTIDEFAQAAKDTVDLGFKALKWDPLKVAKSEDSERVTVLKGLDCLKAVREAVGPSIELGIELHGSLSFDGSLQYAKGSEVYHPMFLEEPMHPDDRQGYLKLSKLSLLPIAAGERYFTRFAHRQIYEDGYLSIIQPDLTHCGGIFETKKMAAMAETYFLKFAPHNSGGPVGTIASAMVDVTCPNFFIQEFSIENLELKDRFFDETFKVEDGYLILSDLPGLGMVPDMDVLKEETYRHFQTF